MDVNLGRMFKGFTTHGIPIGACETRLETRGITDAELREGAHRSGMEELTAWMLDANTVLVFEQG